MDGGDLDGEWVFDPAHTRIGFSARHAMVTIVRGAFNEVDGRVHVDAAEPGRSTVRVRLGAASVDTRHAPRDAHLRSADFFHVERHPDIVFTSTTVREVEDRMFLVTGDLTIRGVTHEVTIPIELRGIERGADGELRAGFEGTRRVDRRQWGLEWQVPLDTGGVLVSERVTMEFEISAVRAAAGGLDDAAPPAVAAAPAAVAPVAAAEPAAAAAPVPATVPGAPRRGRHRAPASGWLARVRGRR